MKPFILSSFLLLSAFSTAFGQQWINPHFDTHRLDYRELGYPQQNLIPADNGRITALLSHSNGLVYGATSGKTQAYLFLYNRYINKVRPLGMIGTATGVHHTLLEGKDGAIYIGGGRSMFAPVQLTADFPVEYEGIEKQLWKDIRKPFEGYEGGHLYRYDPKKGDNQRYLNDSPAPVEDLGVPVVANTIYAMAWNRDSTVIYGITYPDAHFFSHSIRDGKTHDFGEMLERKVFNGPERDWRTVPRALYCDPQTGYLYTSGDNGWIVQFRPGEDTLPQLTYMRLPGEYWESLKSMDYPVVEAFDVGPGGEVYGATTDGYVFKMNPERQELLTLGKPRVMRRTRAMKVGRDGNLYLITGHLDRICKLHTYDLTGGKGFTDLGVPAVDRSPYYQWRAYSFDAMTVGADGTVFMGESDRGGKLFLYMPGPGAFPGQMNPTNPVVERMRPETPALIPEAL